MMAGCYQTNCDWERIAQDVVRPQQAVLVIGTTDVGKSTFSRFLIERGVARGLRVGFVDADVGQSQIGPPTTIGLKIFSSDTSADMTTPPLQFDGEPDALYFVGWMSPNHHELQCVTGTQLMVDAARKAGADFIVIDTTGYVDRVSAIILKQQKIELIQPDHIICIHRSRELDAIVACFDELNSIQIHRLAPHKNVTSKSSVYRRKHRESCFERYFADAVKETLPFDQIRGQGCPFFIGRKANAKELKTLSELIEDRVLYAEWGHHLLVVVTPDVLPNLAYSRLKSHLSAIHLVTELPEYFEGRLVGLLNARRELLSVGIIEAVDFSANQFQIRCKQGATAQTKIVQFGRYKEDRAETEDRGENEG
jgi:polynucleotide 5'-hydroxyl-kinase GRC3/NOL9